MAPLWNIEGNQLLPRIALGFHHVRLSALGWGLAVCVRQIARLLLGPLVLGCLFVSFVSLSFASFPLCLYKEVYACVFVCECLPTGSSLLMIALAIFLWGSPRMTNSHIHYQPPLFHKINSFTSLFSAYTGWCCCGFFSTCARTVVDRRS